MPTLAIMTGTPTITPAPVGAITPAPAGAAGHPATDSIDPAHGPPMLATATAPTPSPMALDLGTPRTLWVLGAVMGAVEPLRRAHLHLAETIDVGDRLIYLGNLIGPGGQGAEVLAEVIQFRRAVLSLPSVIPSDVVFLRGAQEEMLERLLWLAYAPDPAQVLAFIVEQGGEGLLTGVGTSLAEAERACSQGAAALARWSQQIRTRLGPAAERLLCSLRHSAWLGRTSSRQGLAFVASGYASARAPWQQNEAAWWNAPGFVALSEAPAPVDVVVRGHDPEMCGLEVLAHRISLDGGCGRGGELHLARFSADGILRQLHDFTSRYG